MHHHVSLGILRQLTVADHTKIRPLLRAKTSVGSISAHDIAFGSLASSGKGAEDAGAPPGSDFRPSVVLPSAHHWRIPFWPSSSFVGPLFSRSRHHSTAAAENCGLPFRRRFFPPVPVATLPRSSTPPAAARTPRLELHCHLSFATKAPPSSEFHLSPELRRHLSFATRAPSSTELRRHLSLATRAHVHPSSTFHQSFVVTRASSPEIHLFQSSIFDRASSSPALCDHSSSCPKIRRHLSSSELRDQSSTFVRAPPFA